VLHKKYFAERHPTIAQLGVYLGGILIECNQYEKAKEITETNAIWQKKLLITDHICLARSASILGKVYAKFGYFDKAIPLIESAKAKYEKYYGETHIETAHILVLLGQSFLLKGDLEKAEKYLQKAHNIYKQTNHTKVYQCLEALADLYQKRSEQSAKKSDGTQSQRLITKSIEFLRQALDVAKAKFPDDSPHINRIQANLSKAEAGLKA